MDTGRDHGSAAYRGPICAARRRRWRPRPPPTGCYFACLPVPSASERSKPLPRRGTVEGIANATEYPSVRSQGDASVRASAPSSAVSSFLHRSVSRLVSFRSVPSRSVAFGHPFRRSLRSTWHDAAALQWYSGARTRVAENGVSVMREGYAMPERIDESRNEASRV